MPHGELTVFGQGNIKERYAKFFANVSSKFELKAGDIQLLGDWSRVDTPKSGGVDKNVSGHYLLIYSQEAAGWHMEYRSRHLE